MTLHDNTPNMPTSEVNRRCPVCSSPLTRTEEGGPEHDEWGREMWVSPEVRYFECGRVEVDDEIHESDACPVIAALRTDLAKAHRMGDVWRRQVQKMREESAVRSGLGASGFATGAPDA